MRNKYQVFLQGLFSSREQSMVSSEIIREIKSKFSDCSDANARKVIENAVRNGVIKSSKPLTFGHNQFAYINPSRKFDYGIVRDLSKIHRPGIYRILTRIIDNGGIISYYECMKLAACITKKNSTKANTVEEIVSALGELELVRKDNFENVSYLVNCEVDKDAGVHLMQKHNLDMRLDCIFIPTFLVWLSKHNFYNYKSKPQYRNKANPGYGVIHNNLVWDAMFYTSTTGFGEKVGSFDEEQKTLVVIDLKVCDSYTEIDLDGFYDRVQIHRNSVKKDIKRRVMPIVIANGISHEAESSLRNLNILCFDIRVAFGERIIEVLDRLKLISLQQLIHINNETEDEITENVEQALVAIKESGHDSNLSNLKGVFFESIMYQILRKIFNGAVIGEPESNRKIKITNGEGVKLDFEYDLILQTKDEYIVFEFKGYLGNRYIKLGTYDSDTEKPEKETIKWFFGYTFPKAQEKYSNNPESKPVKACYITTAMFEDDALVKLHKLNGGKLKPKTLNVFYDGDKLLKLLKDHKLENERRILAEHFKVIEYKQEE